ncbi:MAG: hypothetical protein HC877_07395 [Thioploca sp.]|nr:hypothetical protein [Thioploca sp.]
MTTADQPLEIQIQRLPSYSPDFMPVKHLWPWLREEMLPIILATIRKQN